MKNMQLSNRDEILKKLSFGVKRKNAGERRKSTNILSAATSALVDMQPVKPKAAETKRRSAVVEDSTLAPEIIKGLQVSTERQGKSRKRKHSEDGPLSASKRREMVNAVRKANKIFVWGTDIAEPCTTLSTLSLPDELLRNLQTYGLTNPTPVQMQAIPLMIDRREVLVSAPTGSGKTLAFALPVILDVLNMRAKKALGKPRVRAVVLEPTRELAKQTYIEFLKFTEGLSISCALMDGDHTKTKTKKCDILVSTPNRLVFALEDKENPLKLSFVRWLVVDESDRLFDTTEGASRSFRDQLATVYQACSGKHTRRAFFSATFSYEVEEWCKTNLDSVAMVCIGQRNSAVDTVDQQLVFTGSEQGKLVALRQLLNGGFEPPALVFVQSKDRARQLATELADERIPIDVIHSDRSQKEREEAIHKFRTGQLWVLICTEVLSRGIDFKGVNLVVNFDLPTSTVSYIHRIGRTGRAGRNGRAVTFFTEQDTKTLRPIANMLRQSGCEVPDYALQLNAPSRNMKKQLLRHAPSRKNISFGGGRNKKRIGNMKMKKSKKTKSTKQASVIGAD